MINFSAILLAAAAFVQPAGEPPAAAPDTKPSAQPPAPAPLSATERPLVGRWAVDVASYVKMVKEHPQDVGLPAGVTEEQISQQLLMAMPVIKSLLFDLRPDRSALLVGAGAAAEGTWRVEGESVHLDGSKTLKNFGIHHDKGVMTLDVPGVAKGIGLRAMKPGKTVTAADLKGEWTLDVEASVKATRVYWEDMLAHMPAPMKDRMEEYFKAMPEELAKSPITIRFEGDKAVMTTSSMPAKDATYAIFSDMVLIKSVGGLKGAQPGDQAPEVAMPLFAEGETLRVPMSSLMGVLKKSAAKTEPAKPAEPPSK